MKIQQQVRHKTCRKPSHYLPDNSGRGKEHHVY
nr:MAG TPA: hypothetical protein [Caudoviricetes sp.]DAM06010.1 MAG TPA: hypothetical protein [Caudoviricetes sp.]DAT61651.1 MAG TPA: hypothetical protein [Caudoviricetes sp.]